MHLIKIAAFFSLSLVRFALAGEIALTIDDPNTYSTALLTPSSRDEKIRRTLKSHGLQAALFVCGMRVDNLEGKEVLQKWDKEGHLIGNHTYFHRSFNDPRETSSDFQVDIDKGESLIKFLRNFVKLFRFPMLKEGETRAKRDSIRKFLKHRGYSMGYVTVDASDWYIDSRLSKRLAIDPASDLKPYRDYYLRHIWDRVLFYDSLAKKAVGKSPRHTLLIHHNLLNALFLEDLIQMIELNGWKVINASVAFRDPIFKRRPNILPAGESIIWALAKKSKCCDSLLRYPAEDGRYEKVAMDRLGL